MDKAVFDTNIIIDILNDHQPAKEIVSGCKKAIISIIVWIEVLAGATVRDEEEKAKRFLSFFEVAQLTPAIVNEAIRIRAHKKLKLPDAIIYATAKVNNCPLITRNTKDFGTSAEDIKVPYSL